MLKLVSSNFKRNMAKMTLITNFSEHFSNGLPLQLGNFVWQMRFVEPVPGSIILMKGLDYVLNTFVIVFFFHVSPSIDNLIIPVRGHGKNLATPSRYDT